MNSLTPNRTKTSIRVLQIIIFTLTAIVFGRIFFLQIIQFETYSIIGEKNSIRLKYVSPARGLIYDRNRVLLVDNEPIFTITITPANFKKETIPLLAELLEVEDRIITHRVNEAQKYSWYRTSPLLKDVNFNSFTNVQENLWRLSGIGHEIGSKRNYPSKVNASHIFGYLREADKNEYEASSDLRLGDKIGKSGLELIYENNLRGNLGIEFLKVNALGQSLGNFEGGRSGTNPVQGDNLITTIDAELQAFAEELMVGKTGAIVAMNPNNGEILALVNSPNYTVDKLAGRIDRGYWAEINSDSTRPLFNRAISSRQPPGSTFKPLMGMIGLHLGYVTPETIIPNNGGYRRGRLYKDIAPLGDYDLETAIAYSSNTYFYSLMDKIGSNGQLNDWHHLIQQIGVSNNRTVDLPSVTKGIIPDSTYFNQRFGFRKWGIGDLINLGIGQGVLSFSPLQITQITSSIANGGYRINPHIVHSIEKSDGSISEIPILYEKIEWIKDDYLNVVTKGMRRVVEEGSARNWVKNDIIDIAGKTGTAQNSQGFSHGWFTSFSPIDEPEIVITVFLENAGFASSSAAPIATLLHEKYYTGTISRSNIYDYVKNWVPKEDNTQRLDNE